MVEFCSETSIHGFSHWGSSSGVRGRVVWGLILVGLVCTTALFTYYILLEYTSNPVFIRSTLNSEDFNTGFVIPVPNFLLCFNHTQFESGLVAEGDEHSATFGRDFFLIYSAYLDEFFPVSQWDGVTWKGRGSTQLCFRILVPKDKVSSSAVSTGANFDLIIQYLPLFFKSNTIDPGLEFWFMAEDEQFLDSESSNTKYQLETSFDYQFDFETPVYRTLLDLENGGSCSANKKLKYYTTYSKINCENECRVEKSLNDKSECNNPLQYPVQTDVRITLDKNCPSEYGNIQFPFLQRKCEETCLQACKNWFYEMGAVIPGVSPLRTKYLAKYRAQLQSGMDAWGGKGNKKVLEGASLEQGIMILGFKFKSKAQYRFVEENDAMTPTKLFSHIGGLLGLFLGISIISVIHLTIYLGTVLIDKIWKPHTLVV